MNVIDTGVVVGKGRACNFGTATNPIILKVDGSPFDLTGETVVATIRAEASPTSAISTSVLEDFTVTKVAATTSGGVYFTLSTGMSALLSGSTDGDPSISVPYLVDVKSSPSYPTLQALRFYVRAVID